jgi:hypothetical protein
MTVTVQLTTGHPLVAEAAELFDAYRQHYGANPRAGDGRAVDAG